MKVKKISNNFSSVTITLESQEEVDKLACLFNFTPVCEADGLFRELYEKLMTHQINYMKYWHKIIDELDFLLDVEKEFGSISAHPAIRQ